MDAPNPLFQETYKLVRENSRMLHAMRRSAFFGSVIKFFFYAVFLLAPLRFYAHYLSPIVADMQKTLGAVHGSGDSASAQFSADLQNLLKQVQAHVPGSTGGAPAQ